MYTMRKKFLTISPPIFSFFLVILVQVGKLMEAHSKFFNFCLLVFFKLGNDCNSILGQEE